LWQANQGDDMKLILNYDDNPIPRWGASLNRKSFGWYLIIDLWRLWLCVGVEPSAGRWTQAEIDAADARADELLKLLDQDEETCV
jgi:hypothetical protein